MDYKSKVSEHNTELQGVLNDIIALPTYDQGYNQGLADGERNVKDTEARTEKDVTAAVDELIENDSFPISVKGGYYSEDVVKNIDLTNILDTRYENAHNDGYNAGYTEGYNDGQLDAGGGGSSDVDGMMLVTDESYDEDGVQFYSLFKFIEATHTNFSEAGEGQFVYTAFNTHPTAYIHLYVWVECRTWEDDGEGGFIENHFPVHNILVIAPNETNSLEIEYEVIDLRIDGMRWSTDGI